MALTLSLVCGIKADVLNAKQEVSEFINVDNPFTQNYIVITALQQLTPSLPQQT
jgi:hypothetical protein